MVSFSFERREGFGAEMESRDSQETSCEHGCPGLSGPGG
jgi:hypothetical protein